MEPLRILLVVEQPLFRQGIRSTLQRMGGCAIVGEAADAAETLACLSTGNPDVALIDAGLSAPDALEIARQLRQLAPRVALIVLTTSDDEELLVPFIAVGAAACYTRTIIPEALQEAVRKVGQGEYVISHEMLVKLQLSGHLFTSLHAEDEAVTRDRNAPLTSREVELLDYVARGMSNKEIANALQISDQTVKNHLTSILKKLAVNDRTAAVVHALQHGWITFHDG